MKKANRISPQSFLKSFGYAIKGLKSATCTERNFQTHLLTVFAIIIIGFVLKIAPWEWVSIIFCFALVLGMELINSSIEKLADILIPEYNEKIGLVKDIAAGAVFICAIAAAVVGAIIFIPKLLFVSF